MPDEDQEIASYPIAAVKASAHSDWARTFVEFVLSAEGRDVLRTYGFRSPS